MFRDGYPLDRLYDWEWLQRAKDHAGLDQPLVGFVPLTLFSGLLIAPLTSLPVLAAKHCWLIVNLALLPAVGWLLRGITGLPFRRIALIGLLAVVPLRTNFQFGQQHVFVLFLFALATWCYFRERHFTAGALLALAAAFKLYPALFALLLVRKRRWRALAGMLVAGVLIGAAGIALFGIEPWRAYALEIIPRAVLRGEVTDPYDTHMSSASGLLRAAADLRAGAEPTPAGARAGGLRAAAALAGGFDPRVRPVAADRRARQAGTGAPRLGGHAGLRAVAVGRHADLPPVPADRQRRAGGGLPRCARSGWRRRARCWSRSPRSVSSRSA